MPGRVMQVIDLTDEPLCGKCLVEQTETEIQQAFIRTQQPECIMLTEAQWDAIRAWTGELGTKYKADPDERHELTLFGFPVWQRKK